MTQQNAKRAKEHLKRIKQLLAERDSPFDDMSDEEIIRKLRKTREEIWEEKLASRP